MRFGFILQEAKTDMDIWEAVKYNKSVDWLETMRSINGKEG